MRIKSRNRIFDVVRSTTWAGVSSGKGLCSESVEIVDLNDFGGFRTRCTVPQDAKHGLSIGGRSLFELHSDIWKAAFWYGDWMATYPLSELRVRIANICQQTTTTCQRHVALASDCGLICCRRTV